MIIGVVGPLGAGKSLLVEYLQSKGYTFFRLSDVIREKAGKEDLDRTELQDSANNLRKKHGLDILAKEVWKKAKSLGSKKIIIDGLRNPGEVEFFRKKGGFYLLAVAANKEIRFQRLKKRASVRDPKTRAQFAEMEKRDLQEEEIFGQQTKATIKLADKKIQNDNSIFAFHSKIDSVLQSLYYESPRKDQKRS